MSTARIELEISPWADRAFVGAVEEVARRVRRSKGVEPAAFVGAERAQTLLREAGYPLACVIDPRTTDEAMARTTHWTVLRDGEAA